MQKAIPALTDEKLAALAAIDGRLEQPAMAPAIEARLSLLRLTERREWPNGPLWRTALGDRLVREARRKYAAQWRREQIVSDGA
jgi:hypothetical protein